MNQPQNRILALGSAVALLLVLLTATRFLAAAPLSVEVIVNAANPTSELLAVWWWQRLARRSRRAGGFPEPHASGDPASC